MDVKFNRRATSEQVQVIRNGVVVPELLHIFDLIAKHNLVLATGHLPEEEALQSLRPLGNTYFKNRPHSPSGCARNIAERPEAVYRARRFGRAFLR